MSGRRRAGDEFDDERARPADRQARGYRRPRDAGIADRTPPPWQAAPDHDPGAGDYGPDPGDYGPGPGEYGPGPGEPPSGSRRGRHSAPSGPPSMPADPYSRPAYREQDVPPGADPRERYDDPAARYPFRGGGYPIGSSRYPNEAGRRPGPGDRYPAPGDPYPPPGDPYPSPFDRYSRSADPYQEPDDRYPAPADRYQGPGDRYDESRDPYPPAASGYPEGRSGPARRAAYPEPGDRSSAGRARADGFGAASPSPRDQRSDPDGYPAARGPRPGPDDGYLPARLPGPAAGRPGPRGEYPPARDSYPGSGGDYDASGGYGPPSSYDAADDARIGGDRPARDGYGDRDDPGIRSGRGDEDDYDFWSEPALREERRGQDERDGARGRDGWGFGDDADDRPARPKRRRGRFAGLLAVLGILAILVPLAIGGFYAYRAISAHFFPADYSGAGTGQVTVQIRPGDTATTVGDRLYALGVVASARAFVNAAEHSQKGNALQPGFYRLHKHMNATLAFNLLLKPSSRIQLKVTIAEGLRESQIIPLLAQKSGIPLSDYKQALRNTGALGLPSYAHGNPEGYLFPATYEIQPGMSATDVIKAMVQAYDQEAANVNLRQAATRGHLTPAQAIVVASLAQAEGGKVSDFPKITRVIYNRLTAGMPLQLDSTVMYALHRYGILASDQQLSVQSPYNTYKHKGLPPGPIDSPGAAAIHAALHPAAGNWLYFVTVNPKTRKTVFTSSSAVFNQLRAELQRNLGGG